MTEQQTNGHDKKGGKWADPKYRRAYGKKWYAKKKAAMKAAGGKVKKPSRKAAKKRGAYDDAIVYLRMAVNSINSRIASGELGDDDMAHLLTKLALKTLRGEK